MPLSGCSALHGVKPNQKNIAYFCICVSLTSLLNYGLYVPYLPTYLCNLRAYVSTYFCIFLSTCFCTYLLTCLPAPVSLPFMYLRIYLLMSFTWLCTYKALFLNFLSASVLLFFTCLPAFFFTCLRAYVCVFVFYTFRVYVPICFTCACALVLLCVFTQLRVFEKQETRNRNKNTLSISMLYNSIN